MLVTNLRFVEMMIFGEKAEMAMQDKSAWGRQVTRSFAIHLFYPICWIKRSSEVNYEPVGHTLHTKFQEHILKSLISNTWQQV